MVLVHAYAIIIALALFAFYMLVYLYRFIEGNFGDSFRSWRDTRKRERAERKRHGAAKELLLADGYGEKLAEFLADHEDLEHLYAERGIKGQDSDPM